jgi:hypothetical protein
LFPSHDQAGGDVFIGGLRVKAVNGVDSSKLKFKGKKRTINKKIKK